MSMQPDQKYPKLLSKKFELVQKCRYGENWDQKGMLYKLVGAGLGIHSFKQLHGKEISYNNYLDLDSAARVLIDLKKYEHAVVILKHTNPNGVAIDSYSQIEAVNRAHSTDPKSSFGGIWGFNKEVGVEAADVMSKDFVECVIAPSYSQEAFKILSKKNDIRLLEFGDFLEKFEYKEPEVRSVLGGLLVQEYDTKPVLGTPKVVSKKGVSEYEMKVLEFSQIVAKWAKSNSAVFVKPTATGIYTLSVGAGQQSRVDAVELAIHKARLYNHDLNNSYMGTDSFFPFPDGLEAAADAGCVAIINPGGSIRDNEVIEAANEKGISLVFTNKRVFRH